MNKEFSKIKNAKNFHNTKEIRLDTKILFQYVLSPWMGQRKDDFMSMIEDHIKESDKIESNAMDLEKELQNVLKDPRQRSSKK